MNLPYPFTLSVLIMLSAAASTAIVGVYAWQRRAVPGALPLTVALFCLALFAVSAALELAVVTAPDKILWIKSQAFWIFTANTAMFCFVLEYTHPRRWLKRPAIVLLAIPVLLFGLLILTNDAHHWLWIAFRFEEAAQPVRGRAIWVMVGYSYTLAGVQGMILLGLLARSPLYRWPIGLILITRLASLSAYQIDLTHRNPFEPVSLTVLVSAFAALVYALALFRFRLFDPIPMARATAIDQMRDGMLVLDVQGQIAELNLAAEKILGVSVERARGRPLAQVLSAGSDLAARLDPTGTLRSDANTKSSHGNASPSHRDASQSHRDASQFEITLGAGNAARNYALHLSPLHDPRGMGLGHLVLLYDVTGQKQAQAQRVEHQRVVATLEEREHLARELHDTLVQATASIRTQAEIAAEWLARGETAPARAALGRLADVAQEMHLDLREYLFGAPSAFAAAEQDFFVGLRAYVERFKQRWAIQTHLQVPVELEQHGLGAAVEAQLVRIIQEALTNARKHAAPQHVDIYFEREDSIVRLVIQDDGCGFETAHLAAPNGRGFGTHAMRDRAQAIGGACEIRSTPGKGTRVVVQVPVD